jgi:pyruvate formate lyase activating enzyme
MITGMKGMILNVMRYSIHDGPGIRTTVFMKGCPLLCKWCHNPEALSGQVEMIYRKERCIRCGNCVAACPQQASSIHDDKIITEWEKCIRCGSCIETCYAEARELIGREMSVEELMKEISRDVAFYDESGGGVTFSGGEPLAQFEYLEEALWACKKKSIHTAVDTSGYASPGILQRVAEFTDTFLYDLKSMDDACHRDFTGVSNELILRNLKMLSALRKEIIIRYPLIPGVNDNSENVRRTGEFINSLGNVTKMQLLPYHETGAEKYERLRMTYEMKATAPALEDAAGRIVDEMRSFGLTVTTGG